MATTKRSLLVIDQLSKNQPRINRLFGVCCRVWKTYGFDRFEYAALESPLHPSREPRRHVTMIFKQQVNDATSRWCHIFCDEDHKQIHDLELFGRMEDSEKVKARLKRAFECGSNATCKCSPRSPILVLTPLC